MKTRKGLTQADAEAAVEQSGSKAAAARLLGVSRRTLYRALAGEYDRAAQDELCSDATQAGAPSSSKKEKQTSPAPAKPAATAVKTPSPAPAPRAESWAFWDFG